MLYGRLGEQERVRALLEAARDRRSGALLPGRTLPRSHPRQEPSALAAHAGICAGSRPQWRSLPRSAPVSAGGDRPDVAVLVAVPASPLKGDNQPGMTMATVTPQDPGQLAHPAASWSAEP